MKTGKDEVLNILRVIRGWLLITGFVRLRLTVERVKTAAGVALFSHMRGKE
ncbi:hypothetical protein SAMN05192562_11332 [Kosakonia arachidis]|uniref:Uncharacterized protein n=1 Tax=Kosakonia arachidis TaxID=551989 RepID=A0A1I7E9Q9_9ENTR|nr:hypothetical protein SAMN05192562_11332 [Kosakonia arachidis]